MKESCLLQFNKISSDRSFQVSGQPGENINIILTYDPLMFEKENAQVVEQVYHPELPTISKPLRQRGDETTGFCYLELAEAESVKASPLALKVLINNELIARQVNDGVTYGLSDWLLLPK